jgi:IclR family transcriptional regulator, KDG regulon repressor
MIAEQAEGSALRNLYRTEGTVPAAGRPRKREAGDGRAPSRNRLIASAAATLDVLEVVGSAGGPVSLTAVVQATGRPKGTIHRMLATLVHTGFLVQDRDTSHYDLTLKLWRLGAATAARLDVVKVARPWFERLVQATDETVHMSVLDVSGGIVYISKVESPRSIRVQTQIGQLSPAWCTATGRSILAFNEELAERLLSGPLKPRTSKTVTDPKRLRAILREVVARGYVVTRAENHPEMGGIAAPVRDHAGAVIAGLGIAVPVFRMSRELVDRCIPHVVRAAAGISADLGYRPKDVGPAERALE